MMQKIILVLDKAVKPAELAEKHALEGAVHSSIPGGGNVSAVYPRHHHTRFALADEPGVTVLPGVHDPTPIGATAAAALAHVNAKAEEPMRAVALRLHDAHGPAFHPDV